jgi:hypothetical protein
VYYEDTDLCGDEFCKHLPPFPLRIFRQVGIKENPMGNDLQPEQSRKQTIKKTDVKRIFKDSQEEII